jgi:hypothetical protein
VILGDGDEYSLGCKESKEESDTRLAFELRAREQYVAALQADLDNNPQTQGSRVEEQNADLIITASFIKGISPQQMRIRGKAMFVAIVPQRKLPATLVFAGYVSRVIHVTKEF